MTSTETLTKTREPHFALNRLRRSKGWSHARLAQAAGVSYITVARIELGLTGNPHEATKAAIAEALEVEVFELWP